MKQITGDEAFFTMTKSIHDGLQGGSRKLTASERQLYLAPRRAMLTCWTKATT